MLQYIIIITLDYFALIKIIYTLAVEKTILMFMYVYYLWKSLLNELLFIHVLETTFLKVIFKVSRAISHFIRPVNTPAILCGVYPRLYVYKREEEIKVLNI